MERSLSNQMEMFDPIEVPDLSVPPIDKELQDLSKQAIDELPKDVGVGALTSPITAAADVVDVGASMPDPKAGTEFMSPIYSALEETFDQLSSAGINRENAEKLIKEVTGIELKGNLGELIGEGVGLPIAALSKAGTSIVSAVAKHGDKLDDVVAEAKNIFRTASGGDDFDGMAPAVAGDVKAQTNQLIAKPDLPDTSISPNMIGLNTPQGRAAVKEYTVAQSKFPNISNEELFQLTGVYKGRDGKFRYELDTTNAKLIGRNFKRVDDSSGSWDSVGGSYIRLDNKNATLGDILNFDTLYKEYSKDLSIPVKGRDKEFKVFKPIQNIKIVRLEDAPFPTKDTTQAAYSAADDTIYIGDTADYQQLLSAILHEVQHAIQRREGFITGSDSSRFLAPDFDEKYAEVKKAVGVLQRKAKKQPNDITLKNALGTAQRRMTRMKTQVKEANTNYMKKYGEIESRNVQLRKNMRIKLQRQGMSDEQIQKIMRTVPPEETQMFKGEPIATQDTFDERDELRNVFKALDPDNQPVAKEMESIVDGSNETGFSRAVFHSTDSPNLRVPKMVPESPSADIGFHVGTTGAANDRIMLQSMARQASQAELDKAFAGKSIMPLRLSDDLKPARLIDVDSFKEPQTWLDTLTRPYISNTELGLVGIPANTQLPSVTLYPKSKNPKTVYMSPVAFKEGVNENVWRSAVLTAEKFNTKNFDTTKSIEDRKEWFEAVKKIATDNGYDSFVYKNMKEGKGDDSYMLLDPKQVKSFTAKDFDPKNPDITMAEGGAIPMDRQMSMFQEGGLEDDGGTIDPVSGNDVPSGSSKAEVRDDIPAQLSEGEFVFPADVVRYIGLEKLMMLRQQAKMGLKMMDEMGQMGNSEEATIPDDLPFGMMDLIIVDNEDEEEYNDKKEMQEGGVVTPQDAGIFYQQPQFAGQGNRPGVATAAPDAASRQFVQQPQQAATPTVRYEQPQTTFGDFLTPPQGGPRTITIVNKETGEKELITFIPGVTKIKEGFVREEDYVPKDIVPETETTRVETAATETEDTSGDERRRKREEEMFGPGGGRLGFKGQGEGVDLKGVQNDLVFGISFDGVNPLTGGRSILAGLAIDGVIPEKIAGDVTVNFKRADIEFSMTGIEYNDIKRTMQEFGSGSSEVRDKLDEYGYEKAMLEKRQKDFMESQAEKIAKEARKSELAKAREIADENRRKAAINAALEKQKREAIAAAERERQYVESQGYQQDDKDDPGGFTVTDSSGQSYRTDSSGTAGAFTGDPVGMEDEYDFNTGGLAGKKKPKPKKKMKRGGLASKK